MKLTVWNRLKLCWEILTVRSGHAHTAQEKILSTFIHGYHAGLKDLHCAVCVRQNLLYKPQCFGKVYESFHDCEPCPVYGLCEMEALIKEL